MRKLRIIPVGNDFIIKDGKQDRALDSDGEFSQFMSDALRFSSESTAWNHIVRKGFTFETEIIGTFKVLFNFEDRLKPLFWAMKAGKAIKSVTCYAGEINKNNREKDFTIKDFYAEYYCVAISSNFECEKYFDLVQTYVGASEKKDVQFYMNWVIDFELYN